MASSNEVVVGRAFGADATEVYFLRVEGLVPGWRFLGPGVLGNGFDVHPYRPQRWCISSADAVIVMTNAAPHLVGTTRHPLPQQVSPVIFCNASESVWISHRSSVPNHTLLFSASSSLWFAP